MAGAPQGADRQVEPPRAYNEGDAAAVLATQRREGGVLLDRKLPTPRSAAALAVPEAHVQCVAHAYARTHGPRTSLSVRKAQHVTCEHET